MKTLRVVLLDDHQVVLAGMKDFLEQTPGICVEGPLRPRALIDHVRQNHLMSLLAITTCPRMRSTGRTEIYRLSAADFSGGKTAGADDDLEPHDCLGII